MSPARIMICVPCRDRKVVVAQCLPTIVDTVRDSVSGVSFHGDVLRCYNDGSTEYDADWLTSIGADWAMNFSGMGIDAMRRTHILDFWEWRHEFTHLLFADSDSLWDEKWRSSMLAVQDRTGALVCGYNTATHDEYGNNTFAEDDDVVWRRFAPGVSYLLDRSHVKKIVDRLPDQWSFDWAIPGVLGYKCAITKPSYVDHIGFRGLHDRNVESGKVSTERALMPTDWLKQKRKEVLAALNLTESS